MRGPLVFSLLLLAVTSTAGDGRSHQTDLQDAIQPVVDAISASAIKAEALWEVVSSKIDPDADSGTVTVGLTFRHKLGGAGIPGESGGRSVGVALIVMSPRILDPAQAYEEHTAGVGGVEFVSEPCGFGERCMAFYRPLPARRLVLKSLIGRVLIQVTADSMDDARTIGTLLEGVLRAREETRAPLGTDELAARRAALKQIHADRMQALERSVEDSETGWEVDARVLRHDAMLTTCFGSVRWRLPERRPSVVAGGYSESPRRMATVAFISYPRLEKEPLSRFTAGATGHEPLPGLGDAAFVGKMPGGGVTLEFLVGHVGLTITAPDLETARRLAQHAEAGFGKTDQGGKLR